VTFHQSGCTIQDPNSRKSWWWASEFLELEKNNIFFINPQKTKFDQNCYIDLLKTSLLPECRPGNDFEFLQDSVPSHRVKVTQRFLRQNTPDVIAADEWASYSPDLNHSDYRIWNIIISCRIWCTKADDFRLQVYRTSKRQSKTSGRRSPLRDC